MTKKITEPREGYVKCEYCDSYVKDRPRSIGAHIGTAHREISKRLFQQPTVFTIRCLECGELVANSKNVLGRHLRKVHSLEYVDYVVKHDYGGVYPTCECGCGKRVTFLKAEQFSRFASVSCSSRGENNPMSYAKRSINPNTGKIRTEEHKKHYSESALRMWQGPDGDRMRELFKTEEYTQKQRESQLHGYATTDRAKKISDGLNRFWSSTEPHVIQLRKEASERTIKLIDAGVIGPSVPFKAEWILNPFTQEEEYMHSSWETEFLNRCTKDGRPVTKKHTLRFEYIATDGRIRTYVPDFVTTDGSNMIFEVKGFEKPDDILKYAAAKKWCLENGWTFEVVGKEHFRRRGGMKA